MSKPTDPAQVAAEQVCDALGKSADDLIRGPCAVIIRAAYAERDKALREALKYYAKKENWEFGYLGDGVWGRLIIDDKGQEARAALSLFREEEGERDGT